LFEIRIVDKYNNRKVWLVRRDRWGHYHVNQVIHGRKFYSCFLRTTRKWLESIGVLEPRQRKIKVIKSDYSYFDGWRLDTSMNVGGLPNG